MQRNMDHKAQSQHSHSTVTAQSHAQGSATWIKKHGTVVAALADAGGGEPEGNDVEVNIPEDMSWQIQSEFAPMKSACDEHQWSHIAHGMEAAAWC